MVEIIHLKAIQQEKILFLSMARQNTIIFLSVACRVSVSRDFFVFLASSASPACLRCICAWFAVVYQFLGL